MDIPRDMLLEIAVFSRLLWEPGCLPPRLEELSVES